MLLTHVCPVVRHTQLPPVHSIVPQHWSELVHAPPGSRQHRLVVGDGLHESPAQQLEALVHALAAAVHVAERHVPDWQVRPEQQSAFAAHDCALVRHTQRPLVHSMLPQHSLLSVHSPLASRQQRLVDGEALHERPEQQLDAVVQAFEADVHVVAA